MAYAYKLTKKGKETVSRFIGECEAFRKEILDGRKDTARDTHLPTIDAILEDIDFWNYPRREKEDDIYNECWGVTDHYDLPLELIYGRDFVETADRLAYEELNRRIG